MIKSIRLIVIDDQSNLDSGIIQRLTDQIPTERHTHFHKTSELRSQLNEAKEALAESNREKEYFADKLHNLNLVINDSNSTIKYLEGKLEDAENRIDHLNFLIGRYTPDDLDILDGEHNQRLKDMKQLEAEIAILKGKLLNESASSAQLQNKINAMTAACRATSCVNAIFTKRFDAMKEELEVLSTNHSQLQCKLRDTEQSNEQLRDKIDTLLITIEKSHRRLNDKTKTTPIEIAELKRTIADLRTRNMRLENMLAKYTGDQHV